MPSQAFDTGWDFGPVLDLIESDLHTASPTSSSLRPAASTPMQDRENDAEDEGRLQLGSFNKLFHELGISDDRPLSLITPPETGTEGSSSSDDVELGSLLELNRALEPTGCHADAVSPNKPKVLVPIGTVLAGATDPASSQAEASCSEPHVSTPTESALEGAPEVSKRRAAKQARKKAKKERKALEKQEKKSAKLEKEQVAKELAQEEDLRKQQEKLVAIAPDPSTPRNEPAHAQQRYFLRSTVGAKIRPDTPVQIDSTPVPTKRATSPTKKKKKDVTTDTQTLGTNKKDQILTSVTTSQIPVPPPAFDRSRSYGTLAQPFTPAPPGTFPSRPPTAPLPTPSVSSIPIQGTPTRSQYVPQPMLGYPHGFYSTPVTAPRGYNGLVPSSVLSAIQPQPQPQPNHQTVNVAGTPGRISRRIVIRSQLDRHVHFHGQLMNNFPEERKWLVAPMQLCNEKLAAEGIHVFVDASNIMIGFKDILRRSGIPPYDLSFDSLALLMERRRPVAKRVSASSHREAAPLPHVTKLVDTSKAVGYENNVKEQVFIRREETDRKKFFKAVDKVGWQKAMKQFPPNGSGSDSETGPATPSTPSAPKWVEQGVDEILHLKMCQSIIDTDVPTTIVLATGDGAEAEHSDGFLAHVERALKKGWKVELLSWRQQLNGGYKNKKFVSKWARQFRVIELDDYLESLIDTS